MELRVAGGVGVREAVERLGGRVISVGEVDGARVFKVLVPEPDFFIEALLSELPSSTPGLGGSTLEARA